MFRILFIGIGTMGFPMAGYLSKFNDVTVYNRSKEKVDKILKDCPTLMKTLDKGIKEDLQMRRGNVKEDKNLNITQKKFG